MILALGIALVVAAFALPLLIAPSSIPEPEPPSPVAHLLDRKETIYENLRDLQAEYHMGKLSDEDYQQTKTDLQRQLAAVLAEVERIESGDAQPAKANA